MDKVYLTSDLILTFATGEEPFLVNENGQEVVTHAEPGEVVWTDSTGITCRRWNWRQGRRTQLTLNTCNVYFVLDRLPPYSIEALMMAGKELMKLLESSSPGSTLTYELLGGKV